MNPTASTEELSVAGLADRVESLDWPQIESDLESDGCAIAKGLLLPDQCRALAALYPQDEPFRSRVVMARHGFGRGEYCDRAMA